MHGCPLKYARSWTHLPSEAHSKLLRCLIDFDGKLDPAGYKRVFTSGIDEVYFHEYDPKTNLFTDTLHSLVYDHAKGYFTEFGVCPSDDGLMLEVRQNPLLKTSDKSDVANFLTTIRRYETKTADVPLLISYVVNEHKEHCSTFYLQKFLEKKDVSGIDVANTYLVNSLTALAAKTVTSSTPDSALFANQFVDKYIDTLDIEGEPVKPIARWGLRGLDEYTHGFAPGTLTLLGAGLSVGKSWVLHEVALFNALDLGANVVIANKEMLFEQVRFRIMCRQTGITHNKIMAGLKYFTEEERHRWEVAKQSLRDLGDRVLFLDSSRCDTAAQIKSEILQHFGNRQVHMCMMDYMDKMSPNKGRYAADHERVAMVSRELNELQIEFKMAGFSATQNNRKGNKNPNADITDLSFIQGAKDAATMVMLAEDPENPYIAPEGNDPGTPGVLLAKVVRGRGHAKGRVFRLIVDFATGSIGEQSEYNRTPIGRATRQRDA